MSATTLDRAGVDRETVDDLDVLVEQIVDTFPTLTPDERTQLGRVSYM